MASKRILDVNATIQAARQLSKKEALQTALDGLSICFNINNNIIYQDAANKKKRTQISDFCARASDILQELMESPEVKALK